MLRPLRPGRGCPQPTGTNPVRDQTVFGNYVHLFNPRWTSESVVAYGIRVFHLTPNGAGYEPTLDVSDTLVSGGFTGSVSYYKEPQFEVPGKPDLRSRSALVQIWRRVRACLDQCRHYLLQSWRGHLHSAELLRRRRVCRAAFRSRHSGPVPLSATTLLLRAADSDSPAAFCRIVIRGQRRSRRLSMQPALKFWHRLANFYGQDQWKATPNLTLTLGLRYDFDIFPSASDVRVIGKLQPHQLRQCAAARRPCLFAQWRQASHPRRLRSLYRTVGLQRPDGWLAGSLRIYPDEQSAGARLSTSLTALLASAHRESSASPVPSWPRRLSAVSPRVASIPLPQTFSSSRWAIFSASFPIPTPNKPASRLKARSEGLDAYRRLSVRPWQRSCPSI